MKKWWFFLLLALLLVGYFVTTPKYVLFYDAPEYVGIVTNNSFFKAIGMGHTPIHPTFIGALWVLVRVVKGIGYGTGHAANLSNLTFGIASVVLFYVLTGSYFNGLKRYLSTILFAFFPGIWIINTNLHVETLALTFYIASLLFLVKYLTIQKRFFLLLFGLTLILLLATHIVTLVWIPSLFTFVLLFGRKSTKNERDIFIKEVVIATSLSVAVSLLLYATVFYFSGKPIIYSLNHLIFEKVGDVYDYSFLGLGRIIRNISLELLRGYGSLTIVVFVLSLYRLLGNRLFSTGHRERSAAIFYNKEIASLSVRLYSGLLAMTPFLLLFLSLFFAGGAWTGDFMVKRMVFMAPIISILLVKQLPKLSTFLVVYLTPIVIANGLLYLPNEDGYPLLRMREMHNELPKRSVVVQTNFVSPFVDQERLEYAWTGSGYFSKIERALDEEKEVFLDSQGLFAPYMQYTGNNLHITSLGKFGESESKNLFSKYYFDLEKVGGAGKRLFFYRLRDTKYPRTSRYGVGGRRNMKEKMGKSNEYRVISGNVEPGSAVLVYSNEFLERIRRERLDYGDPLTWLWVLASGRHEPLGWTYADRDGIFTYPIDKENNGSIFARDEQGNSLEFSHL